MVDRIRALQLSGKLVVAFPGRSVNEEHAQAWADALEPLSDAHAERVVSLLVQRSADPPSVAQVGQTIAEVRGQTMSPDYYGGGWKCVFLDGVECPICHVVHGRLLSHAEQAERWTALTQRNRSLKPCPTCDVVHVKFTHDEFTARTVQTMREMQVGKRR